MKAENVLYKDLGAMEVCNVIRDRIRNSEKNNYSVMDIYDIIDKVISPTEKSSQERKDENI